MAIGSRIQRTCAGLLLTVLPGVLFAAVPTEVLERGYVRIAIANEAPYGYVDSSGTGRGPGPEVAQRVLQRLGVDDVQWVVTSFERLIPGLESRRFDLAAAEMAILPARCERVAFSHPNTSYGEGLLLPTGNPLALHSFEAFAEREDLRVAIMAGADQERMLRALGVPDERVVTIRNNVDAIAQVVSGTADAYAATGLTVRGLADTQQEVEAAKDFRDPHIDGRPVRSWGGFAFPAEEQAFVAAFNDVLGEFRGSDEWRAILERHGFTPEDIDRVPERTTDQLCAGPVQVQ